MIAPPALTGPLPASLEIVTFDAPALTTVTPNVHTETWLQLARRLTRHARRADKNGAGWSPTVYRLAENGRPLTRANGSVEKLTCAVADLDHIQLDDLKGLTDHVRSLGLAGIVYSTFSHTGTAPRVRLVIPFTEAVPADIWPRLWPALNEQVYLRLADRAASDASRMYFAPATPGDETTIAEHWDGDALNWRALPLADPETVTAVTPVATEGRGPAATVEPEDMPILERLFSGPHGAQRLRAWTGDFGDFGGDASAADLSLANGLVAYCRGDVERAERIMRAANWRPKWDERRGATTWLGYTLGKALAAYRSWAGTQDEPEPTTPRDETLEQRVARLERELAQARSVGAVQMTNLRAERAQRQALTETIRAMFEVIAIPDAQMNARTKLVYLFTGREATSRNSRGRTNLPNIAVAEGTGLPEDAVSEIMQDIPARDGSPIERHITREWVPDENGGKRPQSVAQVAVCTPERTYVSVLRAAPTMGGPSDKAQRKKAQARARAADSLADRIEARAASWGRCTQHDNDLVAVKGYCPETDCGEVVGERVIRVDEFDALNPALRDSGDGPPTVVVRTKRPALRDSGQASLIDFAAARVSRPPDRCPIPDCRALEFKQHPDGSWRCLKSGHAAWAPDPVPAIAGGSE